MPAMAFQTPDVCHRSNPYQHVFPDPYRSGGTSSQRQPVDKDIEDPIHGRTVMTRPSTFGWRREEGMKRLPLSICQVRS
jgi:hypothetical protein